MSISFDVGAVVVTYNSASTIARCVQSLVVAGCQPIVVVDNQSSDATLSLVQHLPVQVIVSPRNVGFGAACNQGSHVVATPYLLLLNPDAALQPGALALAVAYLTEHPRVAAVGLQLENEQGQAELDGWGAEVTLWSLLIRKLHRRVRVKMAAQCGWVSGGATLLRREAFEAVDGFDEQVFMYWEDVDLGKRLRVAGWKIVFLPTARVTHARGGSRQHRVISTAHYDQSADRYFQKHYATMICLLHRWWRRLYRLFVPLAQ